MTTEEVDVVVVGYGPGGAVLTSILGQKGHRIAVLERFATPYNLPRMSTLDGEIARVLQHAADSDAFKDSLPQRYGFMYGADGELNLRMDWSEVICGHPSRLSLHQPNIEAAMHRRIDHSCPSVKVYWGTTAIALQDNGDHVVVTGAKANSNNGPAAEIRLRARFVVGMDGGSSFVREALGVQMKVLKKHEDEWLMTDFDIIDPAVKTPLTEVHMDFPRPYYWGPNGDRRCRVDMKLLPSDSSKVRTHAAALNFLQEKTAIAPESVKITRQVTYRFRSEIADRMRVSNVFLGGDAAHLMTPGMAQGSCSAMRDGLNLAWRLDLVMAGKAEASLLDGYEAERYPHVKALVLSSLAMWSLTSESDTPEKAGSRDTMLRLPSAPVPSMPPLTAGFFQRADQNTGSLTPLASTLSPQGRVNIGDREGLLDDLVGFGFQLVSRVPINLSPKHRDLLAKLGSQIIVIGSENADAKDVHGTYQTYFDKHGVVAFLSRPDFYIFGSAATPDDLPVLLDSLAFHLTNAEIRIPGAEFRHRELDVNGYIIRYAEAAPPNPAGTIVSLPGSAGLEMSTSKDRLAERYRVIEINPPGWGDDKEVRPLPQSDNGCLLAKAIKQLVQEPFVLIGTSMGGCNAVYLAVQQQPDEIVGIILEASMAPMRFEDLKPFSTDLPPIHPKKWWATPDFIGQQMVNRKRIIDITPPDMKSAPALKTLRERRTPILGLLGTEDEVAKLSQEETFRAALPEAEFKLVPNGRHDLQNTTPDEFVGIVESFLREHSLAK